jgi:hypothetical protein
VFFDPDVYPMNWAWWDGKMSFEHYREEHGLDTETLMQAARAEANQEHVAGEPAEDAGPPPVAESPSDQATEEIVGTRK